MKNLINKFFKPNNSNDSSKENKIEVYCNKKTMDSLISFFEEKEYTFDDYYYGKRIDKYYTSMSNSIDFEVGKIFIDEAIKILLDKNIPRNITLKYIGFTTYKEDEEVTDYNIRSLKINDLFVGSDEGIFIKKIESRNDIFNILNYHKSYLLPDFLHLSSEEKRYAEINKIDIDSLDVNIKDDGFEIIKKLFLEELEEKDYGFFRKDFFGCEESFEYFICDKEVCYYNLKLIYLFVKELYGHMIEHNFEERKKVFSMSSFRLEYFPNITKDENILAYLMAYNRHYLLDFEKYVGSFDKVSMLKKIIDIVPSNYKLIPQVYQKDIEIVEHMIGHHIEYLSLLIEYGPYEKKDWVNACLNILILD